MSSGLPVVIMWFYRQLISLYNTTNLVIQQIMHSTGYLVLLLQATCTATTNGL